MDKYEIVETIGTGSFSVVNKAIEKETNKFVALKCIDKGRYQTKELKNFQKECAIHARLSHPNIIRMLESFETPENIFVVTEIAAFDLNKFMKRIPKRILPEDHVQMLTANMVSALNYLHSNRILHRDLKPQNILLNEKGMDAKLCDFGLARNMTKNTYVVDSMKGTPLYMAPEVISSQPYDYKADLWSLGCIMYEVLAGDALFPAKSIVDLRERLLQESIKWPSASEHCTSFLQGLLKKDAKDRFTWPNILQHPFVKDRLIILGKCSDISLTNDLTESQTFAKEKQRNEIISKKAKKFIAAREKLCEVQVERHHREAAAMFAQQKHRHEATTTDDNTSLSSLDSVHAIVQTDLENIETDVEGAPIPKAISENTNLFVQRFPDHFVKSNDPKSKPTKADPKLDNSNLVIGTMADNLKNDEIDVQLKQLSLVPSDVPPSRSNVGHNVHQVAAPKQGKNKDLEKRKLNQNLDNFSIRLGTGNATTTSADNVEEADKYQKEMDRPVPIIETNVSVSDSPIENEEWLAFIRSSMHEVLSGQIDSLKQQNLVGMIVAILRNLNASSKVIDSVVQLLILPLVLEISVLDMTEIKNTYVQTKILPNLIFASKLICKSKPMNQSHSSGASTNSESIQRTIEQMNQQKNKPDYVYVKMSELSSDQLITLLRIYELTCHLVHLNGQFLMQFCESIMIIASDLFVHILADVTENPTVIQLASIIIAMLCYTLREVPENAEHIEKIIFHENVNLVPLLKCKSPALKSRMCMLLRIVGRFSCFALQNSWTPELKEALVALATDEDDTVQKRAKSTIEEFSYFAFYNGPPTNV